MNLHRLLGLLAIPAALALAATPVAAFPGPNWTQFGHDAARTGRSPARGPERPIFVPGWPVSCSWCDFGPAVTEFQYPGDPEPRQAVVVGSNDDRTLYAFGSDGQRLPGNWPFHWGWDSPGGTFGFPAVDTVGSALRVYAAIQGDVEPPAVTTGLVFALQASGVWPPGWPWSVPPGGYQILSPPALPPGSKAGRYAPKLYFIYGNAAADTIYLNVLDQAGQSRPGWPVRLAATELLPFAGPAVGPDGTVYVVNETREASSGARSVSVDAYTEDKQRKAGWPVQLGEGVTAASSAPAVGDDGTVYVGVADSGSGSEPYPAGRIYAIAPDGQIRPGWPVELEGTPMYAPAIAADGTVYVSAHRTVGAGAERRDFVYALDRNGRIKPRWPRRFVTSGADALLGEIAGIALDRSGNVFFGRFDRLYGYDPWARALRGWPLRIWGADQLKWPALANDGTLYFFSWHYYHGWNNYLYAVKSDPRPWPWPVPKPIDPTGTTHTGPLRPSPAPHGGP